MDVPLPANSDRVTPSTLWIQLYAPKVEGRQETPMDNAFIGLLCSAATQLLPIDTPVRVELLGQRGDAFTLDGVILDFLDNPNDPIVRVKVIDGHQNDVYDDDRVRRKSHSRLDVRFF